MAIIEPSDNSSVPINVDQRHDRTPRNCEQMPKNKFKWNKLKGCEISIPVTGRLFLNILKILRYGKDLKRGRGS